MVWGSGGPPGPTTGTPQSGVVAMRLPRMGGPENVVPRGADSTGEWQPQSLPASWAANGEAATDMAHYPVTRPEGAGRRPSLIWASTRIRRDGADLACNARRSAEQNRRAGQRGTIVELSVVIPQFHALSAAPAQLATPASAKAPMASMALQGAAAVAAPATFGGSLLHHNAPSRSSLACRAVSQEEEMSDMSNVGLDDVFNLIQQVGCVHSVVAFLVRVTGF